MFSFPFIVIVASFTELGCNSKSIYKGLSDLAKETINSIQVRRGKGQKYVVDEALEDPALPEDQVPVWLWSSALVATMILTVIVMSKLFDVEVGVSILAIFLGFLFSFIGVQCAGDTDINPVSTCAKGQSLLPSK